MPDCIQQRLRSPLAPTSTQSPPADATTARWALAGIEVVRTLQEHRIRLLHPIEVTAFTDEEGGMIGCKAISGAVLSDPEYYRRDDGTPIEDCLAKAGGDWSKIGTVVRSRSNLAAFMELHVEQCGVLETYGKQIGVVEGLVGPQGAAMPKMNTPRQNSVRRALTCCFRL